MIKFPSKHVLFNLSQILVGLETLYIESGVCGEEESTNTNDLVFTKRIFFYDENNVSIEEKNWLVRAAKEQGYDFKLRGLNMPSKFQNLEIHR